MISAARDQRQSKEDEQAHQILGELESRRDGRVEDIAAHHVDYRDYHHGEQAEGSQAVRECAGAIQGL
jgi:hypothetical protein